MYVCPGVCKCCSQIGSAACKLPESSCNYLHMYVCSEITIIQLRLRHLSNLKVHSFILKLRLGYTYVVSIFVELHILVLL